MADVPRRVDGGQMPLAPWPLSPSPLPCLLQIRTTSRAFPLRQTGNHVRVAVCACPSRPAWPARRLFRHCFWSAPNRRSAAILLASTLPRAFPHTDRRLISNSLSTGERNALVCTDRRVSNVACTDRWWPLWGRLSNLVYDPGRIGAPSPRPVLQCGDATNSNTCAQNAQGRRGRVAHCTTRDAGRGRYLARPRES